MSRQPAPRGTAIVKGETIDAVYAHTVRWTSVLVLVVSFIGAMVALNGRWPTPIYAVWTLSPIAIVGGLVLQGFCTLAEWANRKRRLDPRYLAPLALDIGTTYIGFAPLFLPTFTTALDTAGMPASAAQIGAHVGIILIAVWFAYYPEVTLIKD